MGAKKNIKHDLYQCSIIADTAHIEMLYEIHTSPDKEKLLRFGCSQCTKCGVGTPNQRMGDEARLGEMRPSDEPEALAGS